MKRKRIIEIGVVILILAILAAIAIPSFVKARNVTLGTIMLIVIALRCMKGHFTPDNHFAFEAVAWYWHFVDVVWLGLFIFVYII